MPALLLQGLDPDPDQAREWLTRELAKPDYHRPTSWVNSAVEWIGDQLGRLLQNVPQTPVGSAVLLLVVLAVVAAAIYGATRARRRQHRLSAREGAVLEEAGVSAAEYRARAARAMAEGDWDRATVEAFRAITAGADERVLLENSPGRTAHEVAAALGAPFPAHRDALRAAAEHFDHTRYGAQHLTQGTAQSMVRLEAELARTRPVQTLGAL